MTLGTNGGVDMSIHTIDALTKHWRSVTQRTIELRKVSLSEIRMLLLETFTTLHALRNASVVSKSVCVLICEMKNFSWWVNSLKRSPLHGFHPIFSTTIDEMCKEFLTGESDTKAIAKFLNGERTEK